MGKTTVQKAENRGVLLLGTYYLEREGREVLPRYFSYFSLVALAGEKELRLGAGSTNRECLP